MSSNDNSAIGSITWRDLTVDDAPRVRDFYAHVVGWKPEPVKMGNYDDYNMLDANGQCVAGVCHRRGCNTALPPQWLVYIAVANVAESMEKCIALGGKVIDGPRKMGDKQFVVIQDPAGAVCALFGP